MNMLVISVIVMVVGAGLLFAESIAPGFGVFGVSGIVLLIASTVLTLMYVEFGIILVACEFGIIGGGLYLFFRRAKKKLYGNQIILKETLKEDTAGMIDPTDYLGKTGITKTSLRPSGIAEIGGVSLEVVADGVYISENTRVIVKEISGNKLIVKQADETIN